MNFSRVREKRVLDIWRGGEKGTLGPSACEGPRGLVGEKEGGSGGGERTELGTPLTLKLKT